MDFHEYEVAILPHLAKAKSIQDLITASKLDHIKVMRALQWLSNKEVVALSYSHHHQVSLDINGTKYKEQLLPEVRFYNILDDTPQTQTQIMRKANLDAQEFGVSIGQLKKQKVVDSKKEQELMVWSVKPYESPYQKLLDLKYPLVLEELSKDQQNLFADLQKRRNIITVEKKQDIGFKLTPVGKKIKTDKLQTSASSLTQAMLRDGSWKTANFRSFNVNDRVPSISGGKRHYVSQAIEYIKQVWLEMGFSQMEGDIVQSAFWDLDALFVPQDHPARAMQDTFYLKEPASTKLPQVAKTIQKIHQDGGSTGSIGWQTPWSSKEAAQLMLRTHCTALSIQKIQELSQEDLPAKHFAVGRVFRNEAMDPTHLFEFHQVEGIVIGDVNFSHLLGYLKEFFGKLGYPDVRIRPAYFPYTEPSAEVDVWHPTYNKWVELGGAGIFRPEVVQPFIGDQKVLAWGLGLERGIIEYIGASDLRDLYRNDLKKTKEARYWIK